MNILFCLTNIHIPLKLLTLMRFTVKYAGMIILITASTGIGLSFAKQCHKRLQICNELLDLTEKLSTDLAYFATPVNTLLPNLLMDYTHLDFFDKSCLAENTGISSCLSSNENAQLACFLFSLGKSDIKSQLRLIDGFKHNLLNMQEKYNEQYKKNSKLYLSFGFFGGIMLCLVLL